MAAKTQQTQGKVLFFDGIDFVLDANGKISNADNTIGSSNNGNGIYFSEFLYGTEQNNEWAYHIGHHGHVFTEGSRIKDDTSASAIINPFSVTNNTIQQNKSVNYVNGLAANVYAKTITPKITTIDFSTLISHINRLQERIAALENPAIKTYSIKVNVTGLKTGDSFTNHGIPTSIAEDKSFSGKITAPTGYSISSITANPTNGVSVSGNTLTINGAQLTTNLTINIVLTEIKYNVTLTLQHLENGSAKTSTSAIFAIASGTATQQLTNGNQATWTVSIKDAAHWSTPNANNPGDAITCTNGSVSVSGSIITIKSNAVSNSAINVTAVLQPRKDITVTFHTIDGGTLTTRTGLTWYTNANITAVSYSPEGKILTGWSTTQNGTKVLDVDPTSIFVNSNDFYPLVIDAIDYGYYSFNATSKAAIKNLTESDFTKLTKATSEVDCGVQGMSVVLTEGEVAPSIALYTVATNQYSDTATMSAGTTTTGKTKTINGKVYNVWYLSQMTDVTDTTKVKITIN